MSRKLGVSLVCAAMCACSADPAKAPPAEKPTEVAEPAPAVNARELFAPRQESLLASPVVAALPEKVNVVVVVKSWPALLEWAGIDNWPAESRQAAAKELLRWSGLPWLDVDALAADIDTRRPVAIARRLSDTYLGFHTDTPARVVKKIEKATRHEAKVRGEYVVVRIGDFGGTDRWKGSIAETESFKRVLARLHFGDDVAIYGDLGSVRPAMAAGITFEDAHLLAQMAIDTESFTDSHIEGWLATDSVDAKAAAKSPRIAAILAIADADATFALEKIGSRPPYVSRLGAFAVDFSGGPFGSMAEGKAADRLHKQIEALRKERDAAKQRLEKRQAELAGTLRDLLGTAAGFVDVHGDHALVSGGVFFTAPQRKVSEAMTDWLITRTPSSPYQQAIAEIERKIHRADRALERISGRQLAAHLRETEPWLFSSETGGFGLGGTGVGAGGAGTTAGIRKMGMGTMGLGSRAKLTLRGITDPSIRRYAHSKLSRVRRCYNIPSNKGDVDGKLAVSLRVAGDGTIKATTSGMSNTSFERCAAVAMSGIDPALAKKSARFFILIER